MSLQINCSKGNIGIGIVLAIIAVMSGVSLASVAFRDSLSFRYQLDGIQQFHILRSEVGRGRLLAGHFETVPTPPMQTVLPTRTVTVDFGTHRTVYSSRTKLNMFDYDDEGTGFLIRSLITAIRGDGRLSSPDQQSPVKRYGENRIQSLQTIALFHYFSDIDRFIDDIPGRIVFAGEDIIRGRVHSNTDIYVNNSIHGRWPTFYGLVSTSGIVQVGPGGGTNYPFEEIFRGPPPSLIEEYPEIVFEPSAQLVRQRGRQLFGGSERDDAVAHVTVDGTYYELWLGEIDIETEPIEWIEGYNQFTIYSSYPPYGPVGNAIGVNRIPKKDTLWVRESGGNLSNNSMFVPMELWISGEFGGRQTWASSHNIYLKGDLTYRHTNVGERPDGIDENNEQTLPVNAIDYLGIISEESVLIQYGHFCHIDSLRLRPNTDDIYMYGAYCAVGESEKPWEDGMITVQYLWPKGSTPAQFWRGEFFKYIDLHLFHYPTTSMNRWPPGMDYPWYNPIWPEPGRLINVPNYPSRTPNPHNAPEIVRDRGDIWLFGSFAQRRRGAVGTSATGDIQYQWDIYNEISPDNAPTYGFWEVGRTGYGKRYHTDFRFERSGPPHFPLVLFKGYQDEELMDLGYVTLGWIFKSPPRNF